MSWFEFDWLDAFTDHAFGGNGCAVAHGGAGAGVGFVLMWRGEVNLAELAPATV